MKHPSERPGRVKARPFTASVSPSLLAVFTAIFTALFAVSAFAKGHVIERIVAVVDDSVVLLSEVETVVDDIMRAEPPPPGLDPEKYKEARRREILDTLVAEKLLEQEIKKLRIEVSDAEVERVIENIKVQRKIDDQRLEAALAQQGLTLAEYREGLKKQLMKAKIIQLKVKNRVQVSDQDVKSTYASQQRISAQEFRLRARHILFLVPKGADAAAGRRKAEAALARVSGGEDFAKVAIDVSEGPSKNNGGALGVFGRGEMVPEFERAAFAAEPGKPVGPVRSPFGWHIILIEEQVATESAPLEQIEETLRNRLYEEEIERVFNSYIEDLKKQAHIDIRL